MQLIFFMLLVSLTIASVNLTINIKSYQTADLEVKSVRTSIDRIVLAISNRLLMRGILNMANGYEPTSTALVQNRWQVYRDLQKIKIENLTEAEKYLENSGYDYKGAFKALVDSDCITL